jgi:predicted RNA-binding Zn-ribbon protein involved in translation (DUF1610 family)
MTANNPIYFCTNCGWQGFVNDCEIDDWGMLSCPECGESTLEEKNNEH